MPARYEPNARGRTVREIQRRLGGLRTDGIFGAKTSGRLMEAQRMKGISPTGGADAITLRSLGMEMPSVFQRCLELTNAFEGTDFGECNETDIDGAGLTMGIIGFTTKHGEVQALLTKFMNDRPDAYGFLSRQRSDDLRRLISRGNAATVEDWRYFFYRDGTSVLADAATAIRAWGTMPEMRGAQVNWAEKKFWEPAVARANDLGFKTMGALGLFFDIWVQNGRWKTEHQQMYAPQVNDEMGEKPRMAIIAEVVAAASNPEFHDDVYNRKILFSNGDGEIHGAKFSLSAQAFEV